MGAAEKIEKVQPNIMPGLYADIPNEAYHAGPGISKTQLDLAHKSPALLQWSKFAPEDSEKTGALDLGDAIHSILLEPERFDKDFAIAPQIDRRTKDGKARWAEFEAAVDPKKTIITADDARKINLIYGSVMAHPHARWIIEAEGQAECSIYWKEPRTELLCRCRPDKLISKHGWLVDVKTTSDINRIQKSMYDFRYHVQDAFYSDSYKAHFGEAPAGFMFLVVSTSIECGRYPVRLFCLDEDFKQAGRTEYIRDLDMVAHCLATDEWPGYETLSMPHWVKR